LYKRRLETALAEKTALETARQRQQHHTDFHGGKHDGAPTVSLRKRIQTLEEEKAALNVQVRILEEKCLQLEREKATAWETGAGAERQANAGRLDRAEEELEACRAREKELVQWVQTSGAERATMMALLRNGSRQCRAVLAAAGSCGASNGSEASKAGMGLTSIAQRRVHLDKVKRLQQEFQDMLGRLDTEAPPPTEASTSPRRRTQPPRREWHASVSLPGEGKRREERCQGGRGVEDLQGKYEASQALVASLKLELAQAQSPGKGKKPKEHGQEAVAGFPSEADLLRRDNQLMRDRLESVLAQFLGRAPRRGGGHRLPLMEEVEKLLTQAASQFYALASRLQEKEGENAAVEAGGGGGAEGAGEGGREGGETTPVVHAFGRELGHLRRLLSAVEHLTLHLEEERECMAFFFEDVFGAKGRLDPGDRRGEDVEVTFSLPALQNMLVACRDEVETWKRRPSPLHRPPSKRERQAQEDLTVLRRAMEATLPPSDAPLATRALAAAFQEKWTLMVRAVDEGEALVQENAEMAAALEERQDSARARLQQVEKDWEARIAKTKEELDILREAVVVMLVELGVERPNSSSSSSSKASASSFLSSSIAGKSNSRLARSLVESLSACKTRLLLEVTKSIEEEATEGGAEVQGAMLRGRGGDVGMEAGNPGGATGSEGSSLSLVQLLKRFYGAVHAAHRHKHGLQTRLEASEGEKEAEVGALKGRLKGLLRLEEAVQGVLNDVLHHPLLGQFVPADTNSSQRKGGRCVSPKTREDAQDMGLRLQQLVTALGRELDRRESDLEGVWREAESIQRRYEAALEQAESELGVLRKVSQTYEEALVGALGSGVEEEGEEEGEQALEGDDGQRKKKQRKQKKQSLTGNVHGRTGAEEAAAQSIELAGRVREFVQKLRREQEKAMQKCCETEEARVVERTELSEESMRWKGKAALYLRLLTSLEDAARSLVVDGVKKRVKMSSPGGTKKSKALRIRNREGATEDHLGTSKHQDWPTPILSLGTALELEQSQGTGSIELLCGQLLQYSHHATRFYGDANGKAERLHESLVEKEHESQGLRKALHAKSMALADLKEKARASFEEVVRLKRKITMQEADVSSLVSSISRVSEKLTHRRSVSGPPGSIPETGHVCFEDSVGDQVDGSRHQTRSQTTRASQMEDQTQSLVGKYQEELERMQALGEEQAKTIEALVARNALLEEEGREGWPEELEHVKAAKEVVEQQLQTLRRGLAAREKEWAATLSAVNKERERLQRKCGKQQQAMQVLTEQVDHGRIDAETEILQVKTLHETR
jgi:hypothetical protein